jgi:hypothetical protein
LGCRRGSAKNNRLCVGHFECEVSAGHLCGYHTGFECGRVISKFRIGAVKYQIQCVSQEMKENCLLIMKTEMPRLNISKGNVSRAVRIFLVHSAVITKYWSLGNL